MRKIAFAGAVLVFVAAAHGCGSTSSATKESSPAPRQKKEAAAPSNVPADSPLAKVKMGMGSAQVYDLLGAPTSTRNFPSGKAFNPFYYGPDNVRTGAFFKGLGRVVFSGADKVVEITYDPNEDGY